MSLDTYANFKTAIADQLARSDMTSQIVDCITLFEAEASFELFRGRNTEVTTILVPTNPAAVTVTGAANNGSGLIRLTAVTSTFTTGDLAVVANVGGTTEANGEWKLTVIDGTHVDLQGSTFTNAYVSGGTIQEFAGIATLPTDYLGWRRVTWSGSPRAPLQYLHPEEFQFLYPSYPAGIPQYFTIEAGNLKVLPTSGTPLEFDYYQKTAALSGSLNWLFTNHVDAYWNGVLQECYSYLKDYETANIYAQKKLMCFDQVKKHRMREHGTLTIHVEGLTP